MGALVSSGLDYFDFDGQERIRRDSSRYTAFAVGKMGRNSELARTADPHTVDAVKQASKHGFSVNAKIGEQRGSPVLQIRTIDRAPRARPNYGVTFVEPNLEANRVDQLPFDKRPLTRIIAEQFDAWFHIVAYLPSAPTIGKRSKTFRQAVIISGRNV